MQRFLTPAPPEANAAVLRRAMTPYCLAALVALGGCDEQEQPLSASSSSAAMGSGQAPLGKTPPLPGAEAREAAAKAPAASASNLTLGQKAPASQSCPEGMQPIAGGEFWAGSPRERGSPEESPRYRTRLADFCLDRTEVTVSAYAQCVKTGACSPASDKRHFCNARFKDRSKHPINCVSQPQAEAYCQWRKARLPTEVEWEYAARGGSEQRTYSWGDEPPDGRTCWKHPGGSCPVGQYGPGAFGLLDMTGNVWEWTSTNYGPYPWPPVQSDTKVYRGGSWSRRFAKWMSTTLRNRFQPRQWGSHLGFRCAVTPPAATCPFGAAPEGQGCLHGVLDLECGRKLRFNGMRCAREGSPECRPGFSPQPGHGCVLDGGTDRQVAPLDLAAVSRSRSPGFDSDCRAHYPGRPNAYRFTGGSHAARNVVGRRAGCKNRDVGVGWNSSCCP